MKIRILGNTIRYRLKMHETEAVWKEGVIEEVLSFGDNENEALRFQLLKGEDRFSIEQKGMIISVSIPGALVEKWVTTELIGFSERLMTSGGKLIDILIEKDFACLDGEREEEEGSYPNPMENQVC
jgi:hypothetical protein